MSKRAPRYAAFALATIITGSVAAPILAEDAAPAPVELVDAATATVDAAPGTPTPPTGVTPPTKEEVESTVKDAYDNITEGRWGWPLAGALVTLMTLGARWLLSKKWKHIATSDRWGVAIAAIISGVGALGHAWMAPNTSVDATTLWGAITVFGAAIVIYVVPKKVIAPSDKPEPA